MASRPSVVNSDQRIQLELDEILRNDSTVFDGNSGKWFVVSTKWVVKWVSYISGGGSEERPHFIDNETLFESDLTELRPGLRIQKDYRIVNEAVWTLYYNWYGGGPAIWITGENGIQNTSKWQFQKNIGTLRLNLLPHVHTLKCNRKKFVCYSAGTYREREKVAFKVVEGSGIDPEDCYLFRGALEVGSSTDSVLWKKLDHCGLEPYEIRLDDCGCYLQMRTLAGEMVSNMAGPCEIHPPMLDDVIIEGDPMVGNILKARSLYWGGLEGPSEFCWIRVLNGKREKFELRCADPSIPYDSLDRDHDHDGRCYTLTEEDLGAKLKVQVNPIRSDGQRGESKTSLPCKAVRAAGTEMSTGV